MFLINQLIWAVVQGATEFLPVSSSAHLVFLSSVLSIPMGLPKLYFFTALHFGTVLAVIFYFRNLFYEYSRAMIDSIEERKFVFKILLSAFVTAVVALFLEGWTELLSDEPRIVAGMLFSMGLALFSTKFLKEGKRSISDFSLKEAVLLGFIQAIAVFPGISRSGVTIIALSFLGFRPQDAFKLSFLIGIPVILLAFLYEAIKVKAGFLLYILPGIFVSFVVGVFALKLLKNFVLSKRLWWFGIYCWVVAILVSILVK